MKDQYAGLEKTLARRNWMILALMVVVSLLWRSVPFTLGVLGGGVVIALNYHWLGRSLNKLVADPSRAPQRKIWTGANYLLRLVVMGLIIYLLLVHVKVHPIGLAVGLSLYVVNLLYSTIRQLY